MALLAYNLRTSPRVITAGTQSITLPASLVDGKRGLAVNVASLFRLLTSGQQATLEALRVANDVDVIWTDQPEYDTGSLYVRGAQPDAWKALEDAAGALAGSQPPGLVAFLASVSIVAGPQVVNLTGVATAGKGGGQVVKVLRDGRTADTVKTFATDPVTDPTAIYLWERESTGRRLDTLWSGASTDGTDASAAVQSCFDAHRALHVPEVGHLVQIVPAAWYASLVGADRRLSKLYQTDPTKSIIAPAVTGNCQPPSVRHLWFDGGLHGLVIDNANGDESIHQIEDVTFRQQVGTALKVLNSPSSLVRVVGNLFEEGDADAALAFYSDANYNFLHDNWLSMRGQYGVQITSGGSLIMERTVGVPLYGAFRRGAWVKSAGFATRLRSNRFSSDDLAGRCILECSAEGVNTALEITDNWISTWNYAYRLLKLPQDIYLARNQSYGDGLGGLCGLLAHGKGLWIDPAATADYVKHGRVFIDDPKCFWTNSSPAHGLVLVPNPKAAWHNNKTLILSDGVHAPTTFEVKADGGYVAVGGRVTVDLSGCADATAAATAWAAAIAGVGATLDLAASSYTTIVILDNKVFGVAGNVLMTGTVTTDGYLLEGMDAGEDAGHQELPTLLHGRNESPQSCQAARDLRWADVLVSQNAVSAFPNKDASDATKTVTDTAAYDYLNGIPCRQVTALVDGAHFVSYQAGAGWLARAATLGHTYTAALDLVIEGAVAPVTVMLEFYGQQRWFTLGNGTHVINCPMTPYTGADPYWYAYLYQMSSGSVVRFGRLRVVDGKRELHDVNTTVRDAFGATDPVDVTYVWHAAGDRWIVTDVVEGGYPERLYRTRGPASVNGGWSLLWPILPPNVQEIIGHAGRNFAGWTNSGDVTHSVTNAAGPDGEPVCEIVDAGVNPGSFLYSPQADITLPTNCAFHVTATVKATVGTKCSLRLTVYNDPGGAQTVNDVVSGETRDVDAQWRRLHWVMVPAAAAHTKAQVWIYPTDTLDASVGTIQVTDVRLWQEIIA